MLVRVGIAVTCSVVAYTVSYITTRGRSGDDDDDSNKQPLLLPPAAPAPLLSEEEGKAGNRKEEQEDIESEHLVAPDVGASKTPSAAAEFNDHGFSTSQDSQESVNPNSEAGKLVQKEGEAHGTAAHIASSDAEQLHGEGNLERVSMLGGRDLQSSSDLDFKTGNPLQKNSSSKPVEAVNGESENAQADTTRASPGNSDMMGVGRALVGNGEFNEQRSSDSSFELDSLQSKIDANGRIAINATEFEALRGTVHKLREKEKRLEKQLLRYKGLAEEAQGSWGKQKNLVVSAADENVKKEIDHDTATNQVQEELEKDDHVQTSVEEEDEESGQANAADELFLPRKQSKLSSMPVEAATQAAEDGISKRDLMDTKKKQQELEIEVAGLGHANKELEQQRKQLSEKVSAMHTELAHHSKGAQEHNGTKSEVEHLPDVQHANEDVMKQVEGLQNNWFGEVEELVYLRWVNACLRNELHNHQTAVAKVSALDLNKNSSPELLEKAKQLILEYVTSEHLPLRVKDYTEAALDSSSSEKSLYFSESVAIDSDDSAHSSHIHRKQSLIRRIRNWTLRHLEAGTDLSGPVSPAESERWFLFHSDPKHRRRSSGSKVPGETHLHKNVSDMSFNTSLVGGRKIDSNVLSPSPRRTTSDSSIASSSPSLKSDVSSPRHKPNLPLLNTVITEHNPPNGLVATPFQLMAKSPALETMEKHPSIKVRLREAMERHKEIKEKARAERERIQKEKVQEKVDQTSTPQQSLEESSMSVTEGERRVSRLPKPPPKPSIPDGPGLSSSSQGLVGSIPSPLGASAPLDSQPQSKDNMQTAPPEVVELFMSLMKHDLRSNEGTAQGDGEITLDAPSNTVTEIDDRSTHRLAIKADVETLGDFVQTLASQVGAAVYYSIEDVVAIVNWLDEELSHLVDETAVLKHFDWPEAKVDALREAAFEYLDLKKLQEELLLFEDKLELPCEEALKKMLTTLEKVEQSVNGLLRTRDMEIARYKEFNIPIEWMLDSGLVGKIKPECVKLARLYINRVLSELDHEGESAHGEPMQEFLLLQGVRFAFRVHQFVGGFDTETMSSFQALRDRTHIQSANFL